MKLLVKQSLPDPVIFSFLGPNFFLSTLFSISAAYCPQYEIMSSLPKQNTAQNTILYISIFILLDSKVENTEFQTK